MSQMENWLTNDDVQRLVVVVTGIDSGETLERWQFNVCIEDGSGGVEVSVAGGGGGGENNENVAHNVIECGDDEKKSRNDGSSKGTKTVKEVHDEIQAIIRQITASVTFLPLLNEPCSFDLLIYTNKTATVPKKWEDSDPSYIMNSQEVKLRSFTTSFHKVDSMVTYKEKDEWEL